MRFGSVSVSDKAFYLQFQINGIRVLKIAIAQKFDRCLASKQMSTVIP